MFFEEGWWEVSLMRLPDYLSAGAPPSLDVDVHADANLIDVYCDNFAKAERMPLTQLRPRWTFESAAMTWVCYLSDGSLHPVQLPQPHASQPFDAADEGGAPSDAIPL